MLRTNRTTVDSDEKSNDIKDFFNSNLAMDSATGYVDYLLRCLKISDYYTTWNKLIKYFRRFRLLRTVYRIILFILTLLRTSAFIILITLVLTVAIPLSVFAFLAFPLISWIRAFGYNKKMLSLISKKDIYVFFPPRSDAFVKSGFLFNNALDLAERRNGLALIVSPYYLSSACPKGFQKKFYTNCLVNSSKVVVVRRYYYFNLKRKILSKYSNSLNLIY